MRGAGTKFRYIDVATSDGSVRIAASARLTPAQAEEVADTLSKLAARMVHMTRGNALRVKRARTSRSAGRRSGRG